MLTPNDTSGSVWRDDWRVVTTSRIVQMIMVRVTTRAPQPLETRTDR